MHAYFSIELAEQRRSELIRSRPARRVSAWRRRRPAAPAAPALRLVDPLPPRGDRRAADDRRVA
jgi:hypothetical protein